MYLPSDTPPPTPSTQEDGRAGCRQQHPGGRAQGELPTRTQHGQARAAASTWEACASICSLTSAHCCTAGQACARKLRAHCWAASDILYRATLSNLLRQQALRTRTHFYLWTRAALPCLSTALSSCCRGHARDTSCWDNTMTTASMVATQGPPLTSCLPTTWPPAGRAGMGRKRRRTWAFHTALWHYTHTRYLAPPLRAGENLWRGTRKTYHRRAHWHTPHRFTRHPHHTNTHHFHRAHTAALHTFLGAS